MLIDSETDVRAWVRGASGGAARWVEPALGSTPGLPDCWVGAFPEGFKHPVQVHLELKCGEINDDLLCYTVRPEQKREIRRMAEERLPVGFLVGIKGSDTLLFIVPNAAAIDGRVKVLDIDRHNQRYVAVLERPWRFWLGVNFIFSYSLQEHK